VLQFLCDAAKDTGKEEYLRPFIRIGLDLTVSNKRPLDLIAPYHGEHLDSGANVSLGPHEPLPNRLTTESAVLAELIRMPHTQTDIYSNRPACRRRCRLKIQQKRDNADIL